MGGPTLTQPFTDSVIDLALLPRTRVTRPYEVNYIDPDYPNWSVNAGSGAVAVSAGAGAYGEDCLVLTTTGDNAVNELRSAALPANIPAPETYWLLAVAVYAHDVSRVGVMTFEGYQGGFVNGMRSEPARAHVVNQDGVWRLVPVIRQNHPIVVDVGAPNWAAVIDRLEVNVQDVGGGVDGVVQVSLGAWFAISTYLIHRRGSAIFFDQAFASAYERAQYCLEHGVPCAVSVSPWDAQNRTRIGTSGYMTLAQLRNLHNRGAEICVTSAKDLRALSRQERCHELASLKRWTYKHNLIEGNDLFVYPAGQFDDFTAFDVMRFFSAARTLNNLPGIVTCLGPPMAFTLPCLRVTDQAPAALAPYVTYAANYGGLAWFAFRGFHADPSAGDYYNITNFETFVNGMDDDMGATPLAMVTQGV